MLNIKDLLKDKVIEPDKKGARKIYGWSYYGDLCCKELRLNGGFRGRLMRFFMLKGDIKAHGLYMLGVRISKEGKLPEGDEERLRYYFGAVKRMY